MAIRNNSKGDHDAEILERFEEKAWNYPVARFLDAEGRELIPRVEGDWRDAGGLLSRMTEALEKAGRPVPPYLRLAAAELNVAKNETACFAMYCYWTGEKNLSGVEGVLATRIGTMGRYEVIELDYDTKVVSFDALLETARASCGKQVGVMARTDAQVAAAKAAGVPVERTDEPVETEGVKQKYFLQATPFVLYLPMTEAQAVKTNAIAANGGDVRDFLSPSQVALLERMGKLMRDRRSAYLEAIRALAIDRSPKGVVGYAAQLEAALEGIR